MAEVVIRVATFHLTFVAANRAFDFGGDARSCHFCHCPLRVGFGKRFVLIIFPFVLVIF